MRAHFETIWSFSTAKFTVSLEITPSMFPDLSWADAETREKIESGFYTVFDSRVIVRHNETGAELGADYLVESVYENPSDFRDHFGMTRGGFGSYFADMVKEAINQARESVANLGALRLRTA